MGIKHGTTIIIKKKAKTKGTALAKLKKCNGIDKHLKLVPLAYSLDRNHLEAQNKTKHFRKHTEYKKKPYKRDTNSTNAESSNNSRKSF